ncbi:hypothetical protein ACFVFJ_05305 [Streptomyces sp. NPDC057717]|uniref:hypothetical protein n=1 Tax=Streptomyces sp. NPDC057717 TaxID=3346224 RepID=UPI0036830187
MTKKTRIRVARIAAGAVIAAGASLTAAGAASALDIGVNLPGVGAKVHAGGDGVAAGVAIGGEEDPEPTPSDTPPTGIPDPTPPTSDPTPPTEEPTEPTEEPTEPTEDPTTPGNGGGNGGGHHHGGGGGNHGGGGGGNGNTDPDGGNNPVEQGQGKDSLQDTGSVPVAQPAQNGKSGGELAETGAAETTFLLIGAATMIAGGIGFRLLPRLVGGGRTVA